MWTAATYNLYLGADLALLFGATDAASLARRVERVQEQLRATRFEERAEAIARLFARDRPDVVGLQEVSRWSVTDGHPAGHPDGHPGGHCGGQVVSDFLSLLVTALEDAGCGYDVHAVGPAFGGTLPVADGRWMSLRGADVTLVRRGGPVTVTAERTGLFDATLDVVTGLPGVTFPIRRGWGSLDAVADGTPFRFVTTHLEAYDAQVRDAQREELLAAVGSPGTPVVVVGDFNAGPRVVGMPPEYVDAWVAASGDPEGGPTCGQAADLANEHSMLRQRIDYVWVRDATVAGCRVIGADPGDRTLRSGLWPSDHACVVADITF